jgi:hypothetical protein
MRRWVLHGADDAFREEAICRCSTPRDMQGHARSREVVRGPLEYVGWFSRSYVAVFGLVNDGSRGFEVFLRETIHQVDGGV